MQSSLLKRAMVDLSIASSKSLTVRLDHLLLFLVRVCLVVVRRLNIYIVIRHMDLGLRPGNPKVFLEGDISANINMTAIFYWSNVASDFS